MSEQYKPKPQEIIGETRRIEYGFPKDPWERLNCVLSSFNAAPKAVTLLLLREYENI